MKKIAFIVGFLLVSYAIAQTSTPDRSKTGPELTKALNGADVFVKQIRHHYDAGTAPAVCDTVGYGFNVACWCDGVGYISNKEVSIDGGVLPVHEMIPMTAKNLYPVGLLGVNNKKICVRQDAVQSDAGHVVLCNCFRRY